MPKKTETIYDSRGNRVGSRVVGQDEDTLTSGKVGTTAGSGLGAKGVAPEAGAPKPSDFPNDLAAFQRAWREHRAKQGK